MPAYNTPIEFFKPAIESILNQTYKNLELIVVDDGSDKQDIKNIVDGYHDKRLIYINDGHHGAGEARNIGIAHSNGDYIYIMASDDTIDDDTFEICMNLMQEYNPDIVLFKLYGQSSDGRVSVLYHPVDFDVTNPGDTTQLVRKDLIIENNIKYENFKSCNDVTFTYSILACAKKVVKINRCFYHYNTNVPNQISASRGNKAVNIIYAFDALKSNLEKYGLFKLYQKSFNKVFVWCVKGEMLNIIDDEYKKTFLDTLKNKYPKIYRKVFDYKYKIFGKQRINGKRIIYFCGIKLFSYKKSFSIKTNVFDIDIRKHASFLLHRNDIKNLVLGSSTARDGFVPTKDDFNFGGSSQDLYRSYHLYKYCIDSGTPHLKNIVLFFDVFSFGLQLEKTQEAYKSIIYNILYKIPYAFKLDRKYNKFSRKLRRYVKKYKVPDVSKYYGGSLYDNQDNIVDVKGLVEKHLKNNKRGNNQIEYLKKIYDKTQENNQKIYIVLPPYRQDYMDCLPKRDIVFDELDQFLKEHNNITLLDFIDDNKFNLDDFSDCHHVNKKGANKLTKLIKERLNN